MQPCPVCQFRNTDANLRCVRCGALLRHDDKEIAKAEAEASRRTSYTAIRIRGFLETLAARNPLRPLWRVPEGLPYRYPFTAGLLGLLPPLGQLYNRQPGKGLIFTGLAAILITLCILTLHASWSNYLLLAALLVWVWFWNDSVATAIRANGQEWPLRNSLAAACAGVFYAGIVATAAQYLVIALVILLLIAWAQAGTTLNAADRNHPVLAWRVQGAVLLAALAFLAGAAWLSGGWQVISIVRVIADVHTPDIKRRDVVWVNGTSYWFRRPRAGDVVYFDPPRFSIEQPKGAMGVDIYSINMKNYFQRILGVPGDHVIKSGRTLERNGLALPESDHPLGMDDIPDFDVIVPDDRYLLPVGAIPPDLAGQILGKGTGVLSAARSGGILKDYDEARLVKRREIFGRATAILNPPPRRTWLGTSRTE